MIFHLLEKLLQADKGGIYIVEDYKHPEYYNELDDVEKNEPYFDEILSFLKDKIYFESKLISKTKQEFFFKNIKKINVHKGIMIEPSISETPKRNRCIAIHHIPYPQCRMHKQGVPKS